MLGTQKRWQEELFVAGPLSSLISDDHILKQVDKVLDLSWLRKEVADLYCINNGRPGIDPEAAVRLMLAGFFRGIVHDHQLMREARVNIAILWFAGFRLGEKLPDHSSLTKIRRRWGPERFKQIFLKTYSRHRWKIEGVHGEAKTQHGLSRAVKRGLSNVAIQAYLTSAVINLKRLATYAGGLFADFPRYFSDIFAASTSTIVLRLFLTNRTRKVNWKMAG